ncbi:MAG: hypothetical protein Q4B60_05620 [Erysipelotrichaceae bacterium]|nr:hypothetical protein [Erysipelotrichaceae bacterium]
MKKLFAMLLVVAMCFSLVACGNSSEMKETSKNDVSKESVTEGSSEETVKTVEITTDNWQDYFEIVERAETIKNAFDEIDSMRQSAFIVLKNGYEMVGYNTDITVEYNYIMEWRHVEIDIEKGVLTIGELASNLESQEMNGMITNIFESETSLIDGYGRSGDAQTVPTNIEITRIQGTLYYSE